MRCFWRGYQTGIGCVFLGCAFFLYPGYFTIALPVLQPPCQKTHAGRVGNFSKTKTNADPVKCNTDPIITRKLTLTLTCSVLLLKHNKGVNHMPQMSHQAYQNLQACVVRKSYTVHHKYHSPAHIPFKSYASARAYCIQHRLDYKSTWVLTTVNHCA